MRGKPFPKGHIPWNKNKKGLQVAWNKGTKEVCKSNSGSFKKGLIPWNKGKKWSKKIRKKLSKAKKGKRGKETNNWKGGRRIRKKYIILYKPNHPFSDSQGYIFEHRLIVEKHIGRYLTSKEVVHHHNNISNDNRIENLQLCKNNAEHRHLHKN